MLLKLQKRRNDKYCWECSKANPTMSCTRCIRSYHSKCHKKRCDESNVTETANDFVCYVCRAIELQINNDQ